LVCVVVADAAAAGWFFVRDVRVDAALAERLAEPVGVVAAVGEEVAGPVLAAAAAAAQRRQRVDGGERVHAVVAVARADKERERDGERPGFCVCMIRKGGSCPRRRSRTS
jgi:NaMN:DMB phosphoribosyltransferase